MNNVLGATEVAINVFGGIDQSLAPSDLPQGLSADNLNCAFAPGSVQTRPPLRRSSTLPGTAQIIYAYSFTKPDGTNVLLQFTADGKMWANGSQIGTTAPGNRFKCISMFDKAWIAINDGDHGADVPLQFDGTNLDRVSQDGPGAPPTFAATQITSDSYPISTITQPVAEDGHGPWHFSYFLQSSGVGNSSTAGNNVTWYYADITAGASPDADLVAAWNTGKPVYLFLSYSTDNDSTFTFGPTTALVTGIGTGQPPGNPHTFAYFTITVSSNALTYHRGSDGSQMTTDYQRTLATVTTTVPVPDVVAGDQIDITAASVSNWDSVWPVQQTLNSGQMSITQTSVTSGIATYNYTMISGAPPVALQNVTVTGTLNDGGALNVTNQPIQTSTGGSSGSFTVAVSAPNASGAVETGSAITAGTQFAIEPALLTLGGNTSPIYGNSTGGDLVFAGSQAVVAPGTRLGVVFFITRSGYTTKPSPRATFTVPTNTNAIQVTNLPIGPSNVIARAVAFTGANGGNFFYLPVAPQLNGTVSGTSTVVNDNTTTSATFYFSDDSLLAGTAIDIPGNNLFRQVVLGPSLAMFPYAGRLFAWGERNKVQSFLNMGFEGGVTATAPNVPLGWTVTGTGTLTAGVYGLAWSPNAGALISQPAYQDENGVAILQGGTQYTFRCWTTSSVTATIASPSTGFTATATVTASGGYAQANFSAVLPASIPPDMQISFSGGLMDELELVYTQNPYLQTCRASYIDNSEAFDGVTGLIGPANDPHAIRTLYLRRDVLHMLTYGPDGSLYETQDTASGEPNTWLVSQLAAKCGSLSVWGDAQFEDWQVWASDTGLRIFDGGSVEKMSQEVQAWWNTFNPSATNLTVVANDPIARRIYIGACTGSSTSLNSLFVLDYRELNTAGAMANSSPLKIGFSGKMLTTDLTRKWSPWSVAANYFGVLNGKMTFCGGGSLNEAVCYTLLEGNFAGVDDDYGWFQSYYCPYFMLTAEEAQNLRLQAARKLFTFMTLNIFGMGQFQVTPLINLESNPGTPSRALNASASATYDIQIPWNFAADRASFKITSVQSSGVGGFLLSGLTVWLVDHPYSVVRGWNGA